MLDSMLSGITTKNEDDQRTSERTSGRTDRRTSERTSGRTDGHLFNVKPMHNFQCPHYLCNTITITVY